jgi:hypothetical protein
MLLIRYLSGNIVKSLNFVVSSASKILAKVPLLAKFLNLYKVIVVCVFAAQLHKTHTTSLSSK